MTTQIITTQGLGNILNGFITHLEFQNNFTARNVFQMLFLLGFRVGELKKIQEWTITEGVVKAPTSKSGSDREFNLSDLPSHLQSLIVRSIDENKNFIYRRDYYYYYNLAKNFFLAYQLRVNNTFEPTHIFRHHFVKYHTDNGKTDEWLKEFLGLVKIQTLVVYQDSVITVTTL